MPVKKFCTNPVCRDSSCLNAMQFCQPMPVRKNTKKTEIPEDTVTPEVESVSSVSSESSVASEKSVSSIKSKKLKKISSLSSNSKSSKSSETVSSSSNSESSETESTSSWSSSEQVVPILTKRNKKETPVAEEDEDNETEEVVINGCKHPNCNDSQYNVKLVQSGNTCNDPSCMDSNCAASANSALSSSCGDPKCSDCEKNHSSGPRNAFIGIAGILILAIIGYMTFIKIKAKRTRTPTNKSYLSNVVIES